MIRPLLVIAVTLTGCWPGPEVGPRIELPIITTDGGFTATDGGMKFQKLLATVLEPTCAASFCHTGSPPPVAPMTLEPDVAYAQLVNAPASQEPGLMRVKPGDPANSYLMIKLRALSSDSYGTTQMPLNLTPLDEETLQAIEAWIASGAPND